MKRRGSALLIVLGMLAFMVVSAVSFAMFMRQSRVPSSYLRRTASSRYLLKAALANAIARLDGQFASCLQIGNDSLGYSPDSGYCEGVYDDPYPGVGPSRNGDDSYHSRNGDYWEKRVFCPFGLVGTREDQNQVPHYRTVSTLTLEGLAYLPPAIINEVRVYSRLTRTAMWRNLAFDAGRYAFCAVDVSDCFDINRMSAGMRRSSAPGERVNLSSLFPDNGSSLDTILKQCSNFWTPGGGNIPFTSVADFNIVAQGTAFSPFGQAINSGNGLEQHIRPNAQSVSNALFITDTWFPPTNTVGTVKRFDLASDNPNHQPFRSYSPTANFLDTARSQTELCKVLMKNIGGVGLACLYDYLDENDRPISFVVPAVETVPMVCGVGLAHNSRFAPRAGADGGEITGGTRTTPYVAGATHGTTPANGWEYRWLAQKYSLNQLLSSNMKLTGVTAYPFKRIAARGDSLRDGSFTGEALVRVFMGPAAVNSRLAADSPLAINGTGDWQDGVKDGVVSIRCTLSGLSFASDVKTTQDAVKQFTADVNAPNVNMPVFWTVREQEQNLSDPENPIPWRDCAGSEYYSLDGIKSAANALVPYDADGRVAAWWKGANAGSDPTAGGTTAPQKVTPGTDAYVPHVLVWVRIMHNGNTVDIVPARIEDDGIWGGSAFNAQGMAAKFGDGTPVLEFRGDAGRAFTYDTSIVQKLDGQAETFPQWAQLYAVDPRYNYAPENWFAMAGNGDAKPDDWLTAIGAETTGGVLGTNGRDPDIFMFTSDQEHLQSVGELAFLPWVQEMDGSGDFFENDYLNGCNFNGADFANRIISGTTLPSDPNSLRQRFASANYFWRTYTAVDHGDGTDAIYGLRDGGTPVEISSGTGDFRVNPFSPDTRVLMAALKDTPADWTFASDNESRNPSYTKTTAQRGTWAFCEANDKAKVYDDELEDIAWSLRDRFADWALRTTPDRFDWGRAFDDMRWYDDTNGNKVGDAQKRIFGNYIDEDLDQPLHGVDRKFLHGFWRECFQNRQQLFLVFVRAEPLTVGGAGEGSLASAQLGARGVALVWRDPQPPARGGQRPPRTSLTRPDAFKQLFDTFGPHRTRVLFYHQFD